MNENRFAKTYYYYVKNMLIIMSGRSSSDCRLALYIKIINCFNRALTQAIFKHT